MRGFRRVTGRALASAVARLVFVVSSCSFGNDPYQIPTDHLCQNTPSTTAAQVIEPCVAPPRASAAADLGRIVFTADEALYVLSLRTGSVTSIETPDPSAVVVTRPGVALIGSAAYGGDPQRRVLFDFKGACQLDWTSGGGASTRSARHPCSARSAVGCSSRLHKPTQTRAT